MDELEELRKAKLEQYKEQSMMQQQIAQLEAIARNCLDGDAVERYNNLKIAHEELAVQALMVIAQLSQAGQLKGMITDQQFKEILLKLNPQKRDFNITRK